MRLRRLSNPPDCLKRCAQWFAVVLLVLTGCNDGYGVNKMSVEDFFNDPRILLLIKAAEKGDVAKLQKVVQDGADPNTFGRDEMTPLLWELGKQNKKAMKALLAVGADPNLADSEGDSPMSMVAGAKDTELMKILLEGGGDPNVKNSVGEPALSIAVGPQRLENVKMLLDFGADINATDRMGATPVLDAATLNQFEIVAYLLEQGADHKKANDTGATLAWRVQERQVDPSLPHFKWREKVIKMLEERGVTFPVRSPITSPLDPEQRD